MKPATPDHRRASVRQDRGALVARATGAIGLAGAGGRDCDCDCDCAPMFPANAL